jgi:hypothetical protein
MTNSNVASAADSIRAAGNELYARQSCRELDEKFGIDAVVAYGEDGLPTGQVAVDPHDLEAAIPVYAEQSEEGE